MRFLELIGRQWFDSAEGGLWITRLKRREAAIEARFHRLVSLERTSGRHMDRSVVTPRKFGSQLSISYGSGEESKPTPKPERVQTVAT